MIFITILLSILFAVQYISQSDKVLRRLITRRRILSHRVSYQDIVRISTQMYSKLHWLNDLSCRVYQSKNGRLYRYQRINGHISVKFISHLQAWSIIAFTHANLTGKNIVSYGNSTTHVWYTPAPAAI